MEDGTNRAPRLWEVDASRGLGVLLMVFYHLLWDLAHFGLSSLEVTRGGWLIFARSTAALFLSLVGVSLHLTMVRYPEAIRRRIWRERGVKVLGWAFVITLVTRPLLGDRYILFGILHVIGLALLLAPALLRRPFGVTATGLLGVLLLAAGFWIHRFSGPDWLIPLGIAPATYDSVDYYPVVPWLGFVFIGVGLGRYLYPAGRRLRPLPKQPPGAMRPLIWSGRNALSIYLLHQPVLFLGFMLLGYSVW